MSENTITVSKIEHSKQKNQMFIQFLSFSFVTLSCYLQHYFMDAWNSFDALIVVGSVVDIVVTEFSVSIPMSTTTVPVHV